MGHDTSALFISNIFLLLSLSIFSYIKMPKIKLFQNARLILILCFLFVLYYLANEFLVNGILFKQIVFAILFLVTYIGLLKLFNEFSVKDKKMIKDLININKLAKCVTGELGIRFFRKKM